MASAEPAEPSCLILYHVPKTAGTMVTRWLRSHDLPVWSYTNQQLNSSVPIDGTPAVDLLSARVYIGHVAPASAKGSFRDFLRDRGVTKRCAEWTILRRPAPRVLSAARYFLPCAGSADVLACLCILLIPAAVALPVIIFKQTDNIWV